MNLWVSSLKALQSFAWGMKTIKRFYEEWNNKKAQASSMCGKKTFGEDNSWEKNNHDKKTDLWRAVVVWFPICLGGFAMITDSRQVDNLWFLLLWPKSEQVSRSPFRKDEQSLFLAVIFLRQQFLLETQPKWVNYIFK